MAAKRRAGAAAPDIEDGTTLPRWFLWLAVVSIALALLFPFKPVKLILAPVFGAAFFAVCRPYPERAVYLFILAMPVLDLLPPDLIPVPGLNAPTIMMLWLWAMAWAGRDRQDGPAPKNPWVAPAAYYAGLLALSAVLADAAGVLVFQQGRWASPTFADQFANWKNRIHYIFLAPIAFRLMWTPRHARTVVRLVAIMTLLVCVHSLWDIRENFIAGLRLEGNRAVGLIAAQPNLYGGFLAMLVAAYVPVFLGSGGFSFRERLLYAAVVVAGGANLLFTLSRGSWLALALGLAVIALFRGAKLLVFLLVVASTSSLWLPQQVVDRIELTKEGSRENPDQEFDDSTQVRVDQWNALPSLLQEEPIFGHGFRSFPGIWERVGPDRRPKAAHSSIIEIGVETGLLGLAGYAWLVAMLAWSGWKARQRSSDPLMRELAIGMIAASVCLLMLDASGTRFRSAEVMGYLWILAGTLYRASMYRPADGATPVEVPAVPAAKRSRWGHRRVGSVKPAAAPPRADGA